MELCFYIDELAKVPGDTQVKKIKDKELKLNNSYIYFSKIIDKELSKLYNNKAKRALNINF